MRKLIGGIIGTGILIAVIGSAVLLYNSRSHSSIDGHWAARMLRPGGAPFNIELDLRIDGRTLTGTMDSAPLESGSYDDGKLRFTTQGGTAWTGTVRGREIDLLATSPGTLPAKGVARKRE